MRPTDGAMKSAPELSDGDADIERADRKREDLCELTSFVDFGLKAAIHSRYMTFEASMFCSVD
jgi:hypothetical protein